MTNWPKRVVLRAIERAGYRVLKQGAFDDLIARAAQSSLPPTSAPPVADPVPPAVVASPSLSPAFTSSNDPELARIVQSIAGVAGLPAPRVTALAALMQHLVHRRIPGDIVDCGHGGTATLATVAAAACAMGETDRRLILFDTTGDPLHRPEPELTLWGSEIDVLAGARLAKKTAFVEPAPAPIADTGYPVKNISVRRYPREPIEHSTPIGLLFLQTDTFESNRTAIAAFVPHVVRGGIVAVERDPYNQSSRDAVDEYLAGAGLEIFFIPVDVNFRIGLRA